MQREQTLSMGPIPVMDRPLSMPAERVDLHSASSAIRSLVASMRSED
jgi:hypothetical protein